MILKNKIQHYACIMIRQLTFYLGTVVCVWFSNFHGQAHASMGSNSDTFPAGGVNGDWLVSFVIRDTSDGKGCPRRY
jgi:hypothetical protein